MTLSCQLTNAEMAEALRMNLTAKSWMRAMLSNLRVMFYLALLLILVGTQMARHGSVDWKAVGTLAVFIVLLVVLAGVRIYRSIRKSANQINQDCSQITVDGQGITAEGKNGTRTSVPWSALNRWKEGKLVFTVGDGKTFRTFSKTALGEMQSGELRSLLMANIR